MRVFDYVIVGAGSAGSALGEPADRGRQDQRARAGVRRLRPFDLHPDAGGAVDPAQHESLQLGLLERAGAAAQQPPHLLPARQGARRLLLDQRPRLCARPRARFRPLGGRGRARLVLRKRAALFPPRRDVPRTSPANIAAATARWSPRRARGGTRSSTPSSRRDGRPAIPSATTSTARWARGFGGFDMTVKDGVRWSAANAYLRPAMKRPNLTVETHALATKILFEGTRAVGVAYERRGGAERRARAARGDPVRRRDQLAATAEALRRRARRGVAGARHSGGARSARRRREPAGSSRILFPGRLETADHALSPDRPCRPRLGRRCTGCCAARASARPTISRPARFIRSRAGRRASRHPVPFPAAGGDLRRQHAGERARLPGACRLAALEEPRLCPPASRPTRATAPTHRVQLHEPSRRLDGDARLRAADARDLRAARLRPLSRPRDPAGRGASQRRRRSTPSCASSSRAPITPAAPARWARRTIRWRWSIRETRVIGARRRCGSSIPRSCRRSPPAISTRRRS